MNDALFRFALAALLAAFFVVRAYHHHNAVVGGGKIEYKEKNLMLLRVMRLGLFLVFLPAFVVWLIRPQWIGMAALPFPNWLRASGVAIGFANLPLLWWIEATLGKNFNTTLHIREGHTLVTDGPYRWVRHPMYSLAAHPGDRHHADFSQRADLASDGVRAERHPRQPCRS